MMISTTLGMTKTLYQSTISSLRLQKILTAMGIPEMSMRSLDPPFLQVALLHPLIPPIVTPCFVFFMTQLKLLETARVPKKTNQTIIPQLKPLKTARVTKKMNQTIIQHLRPELIQMESVHTSYWYMIRRTYNIRYCQSLYQTRNQEVVVEPWQEGVDIIRNSWYCL
jgi:hypothetical protein